MIAIERARPIDDATSAIPASTAARFSISLRRQNPLVVPEAITATS